MITVKKESRKKLKLIEELAGLIRDSLGVHCSVVDMENVLQQTGAEVEFDVYLSDIDPTIIEKRENQLKITVAASASSEVIRGKLAKAFGFAVLSKGFYVDDELWGKGHNQIYVPTPAEDVDAALFAGAFLMPECAFYQKAEEFREGSLYQTYLISRYFGVTNTMGSERGIALGIFQRW